MIDLESIRSKYTARSDDDLGRDLILGPEAFASPEVWSIVVAEARNRGFPESQIPVDAADPLVILGSFQPNLEIIQGPFERAAEFREDGTLLLIDKHSRLRPVKDRIEHLIVATSVRSFTLRKKGFGSVGRSATTALFGFGIVGGLLSGLLFQKTRVGLSVFALSLQDGRTFVGRAEPELVAKLEKACPHE